MPALLRLSVLDQSPVLAGSTPAAAIAETLALAQACEQWGYHRYWVAEHHATSAFASAAPEVLLAALAGATAQIRIGSGGVMLPYYSPYKVAEQFRLLEVLAPGRVDLGIGRAPGGAPKVQAALRAGPASWPLEVFPQQLILLQQFLQDAQGHAHEQGGFSEEHPYFGIRAQPIGKGAPEMWVLGSSHDGAVLAGQLGLPYCFAHFINADGISQAIDLYRSQFRPRPQMPKPRVAIAAAALVAATQAAAEKSSLVRDFWAVRLLQNRAKGFPSPKEAEAWQPDAAERALLDAVRARIYLGKAATVAAGLAALQNAYGADEMFVVTIADSSDARRESYKQLAQAASLRSRAPEDTKKAL